MSAKQLFKYRNVWMGLAMIWIVWFHSGLDVSNKIVSFIKEVGYGGVDIFLFASGIGCYCSLDKNGDAYEFLKRRIKRIIPTYWTLLLIWIIFRKIYGGISLRTILGNILCVRYLTGLGGELNWYISAMWLMYLLSPYFKGIIDRMNTLWQLFLIIVLLVLFSICFWDVRIYTIIMVRIPIYFIGMYAGKMMQMEGAIQKRHIALLIVTLFVGIGLLVYWQGIYTDQLYDKGYHWYPFILITPGACMLISYFMEWIKHMDKLKIVERILSKIGKVSFEVYLLHIWFFKELDYYLLVNGIGEEKTIYWIVMIISLIPACFILINLEKVVRNICSKMVCIINERMRIN